MKSFFVALSFLTRVPVPASTHQVDALDLRRATAHFPLVGALVGLATAAVIWLGAHVWPLWLAVVVALAFEARLTGAFHEDAVADSFDAFGGGFTRERVLEILKDSRLGTYGTLALVLAVSLRALSTVALDPHMLVAAVVAAASLGRWFGMLLLFVLPPAIERTTLAKDVAGITAREVVIGGVWSALACSAFAWNTPFRALFALIVSCALLLWVKAYVQRRIGGSTGDVLGALTYGVQLVVLLAAASR